MNWLWKNVMEADINYLDDTNCVMDHPEGHKRKS